jgi:hypothetical protein
MIDNKMVFSKIFVALKPCTNEFVHVAGIDGHNWLFPVAYGIFNLETTEK